MALIPEIKECIENSLSKGFNRFIIFPFGEIGMQVNAILEDAYNIKATYILDNNLCKFNPNIKPLSFLSEIKDPDCCLIFACKNPTIYTKLKQEVLQYIEDHRLFEIASLKSTTTKKNLTKTGKYSYGPLCNHWLVESVGAFCSFAKGSDVVPNHSLKYISTHPFLFFTHECNEVFDKSYNEYADRKWYFEGVYPKGTVEKLKKSKIGNDVWLGKNVTVTNGSNIGNGVIAAAGAVITKDVPDYAIVAGIPAKIIGYRYTPEQITALNTIQWWNWSDDEIRERYDDFYLSIEQFIVKYLQ